MTDHPRPVWPDRLTRDAMQRAANLLADEGKDWAEPEFTAGAAALQALIAAWDAAPADSAEAMARDMCGNQPGFSWEDRSEGEREHLRAVARSALAALGMPDA